MENRRGGGRMLPEHRGGLLSLLFLTAVHPPRPCPSYQRPSPVPLLLSSLPSSCAINFPLGCDHCPRRNHKEAAIQFCIGPHFFLFLSFLLFLSIYCMKQMMPKQLECWILKKSVFCNTLWGLLVADVQIQTWHNLLWRSQSGYKVI